jgi:hypothetical protein
VSFIYLVFLRSKRKKTKDFAFHLGSEKHFLALLHLQNRSKIRNAIFNEKPMG